MLRLVIPTLLLVTLAGPACVAADPDLSKLYAELAKREAALARDDVEDLADLAKWCRGKRMLRSMSRFYGKVIALDPEHGEARKALGHVSEDDKWYTSLDEAKTAKGLIKRPEGWVVPGEKRDDLRPVHGYWLGPEERDTLDKGGAIQGHKVDGELQIITREYLIRTRYKTAKSLDMARLLEQAIRQWRSESGTEYKRPDEGKAPPTLHVSILANQAAFKKMITSDIESFSQELKTAQGFFDGHTCHLSFFHDFYRTVRVLLHEARHQFDSLVTGLMFNMPGWYREGIAEYFSMHTWDGEKLTMGELNPENNYSLHFAGRLLKRKKIKGAEEMLKDESQSKPDPEWYQNAWAFIYYVKKGPCAEGFAEWETLVSAGKLRDSEKALAMFRELVAEDLEKFDKDYREQLKEWAELVPE